MFLECNRMLSDHLKDATNGIDAMLDTMASEGLYDSGDNQPADIGSAITDETRNIEVARRFPPLELSGDNKPSISIFIVDVAQFGAPGRSGGSPVASQGFRDAQVTIAIRYYIENPETDEAFRDAYYYARATAKSIAKFNQLDSADRKRNNVCLSQFLQMNFRPLYQEPESTGLDWYYLLTFKVRDERP